MKRVSVVDCSLGGTLALPSAPSSPSAPSASPGLSVAGVLLVEEMGLDAACREDLMVRNKHNDVASSLFFSFSLNSS